MDHPIHLQELLAWYADAGLDYAMDDAPVDRFAEAKAAEDAKTTATPKSAPQKSVEAPQAAKATTQQQAVPNQQAVADAQNLASSAKDLAALKHTLAGFEGCNLRFAAKATVFGAGHPNASLMIVGDPPGRDEEDENAPFAGPALTMLEGMLGVLGMKVEQTYCAPVIPWKSPGDRAPSPLEMQICLPFLHRQIALVQPDYLLILGGTAAQGLIAPKSTILAMRGKWRELAIENRTISALPTLSPRYLLKTPGHKRFAFNDLLLLKEKMNGAQGSL